MALTPEQVDAVQHQIMALVRTYLLENKSIDKYTVTMYLNEVAAVEVTEHEVEELVKGLFSTNSPSPLRTLSLAQALLFSNAVFGWYDNDYSFVVLCCWGQHKTACCYLVYALTANVLLEPTPVYLCTKEHALKEFLAGYKMCPSEWLPIPLEKGLQVVRKTQIEVDNLVAAKLAALREAGPIRLV